jgi:DNA-binding GntR family transcriptional regulator
MASEAAPLGFLFSPVRAPTLKEKVASQIHTAILSGDLAPGARIVETRLAKQMNVAQTTVREAIQDLENQGLVVKYVNRETQVRKFTRRDIENLFHVRLELEGLAVELAKQNAKEKTLEPLYLIVDQMRQAARKNAIAEFYNLDVKFHRALWALTGNEFLEKSIAPLSVGPIAFVLAGSPAPLKGNYLQVADDHAEILDALLRQTPKGARRYMQGKLRAWHKLQLRSLRDSKP